VNALLLNSIWINLVSLGSTYFSLERLIAGEWSILIVYIGGSVVGKWVAMTKVEMYQKRIKRVYNKLKNK
jgi:hypothetical protein